MHLVEVDDFLEAMEVLNVTRASADERLFSCPFPGHTHGDTRPSAYMNDGSKEREKATAWKCHGCGRSGNAITFYAEMENVSKQEAAAHLREQYAPNYRPPKGGKISIEFEDRLRRLEREEDDHAQPEIPWHVYDRRFGVNWVETWKTIYKSEHCPPEVAYLFDRGFEPETLDSWKIGYDARTDRLTIPVCDEEGVLVGIKGRTWKEKKREKIKYLILGDKEDQHRYGWKHYEKSLVLFGLHMLAGPVKALVLVEGELDVIALWQIGIPAVCTGSAHLSDEQSRIIRRWCEEVIVLYDANTERATWGYEDSDGEFHPGVVQKLDSFLHVRVCAEHEGDPSQWVEDGNTAYARYLILSAKPSFRIELD